jgi:hypothetical protein
MNEDVRWIQRKADMYGEHTLSRNERHRLQAGEHDERVRAAAARERATTEQKRVKLERARRVVQEIAVLRVDHDTLRKAYTETIEHLQRLDLDEAIDELGKVITLALHNNEHLDQHDDAIKKIQNSAAAVEVAQEQLTKKFDDELERLTEGRNLLAETLAAVKVRDEERDDEVRQLRAELAEIRLKNSEARIAASDVLHGNIMRTVEMSRKIIRTKRAARGYIDSRSGSGQRSRDANS